MTRAGIRAEADAAIARLNAAADAHFHAVRRYGRQSREAQQADAAWWAQIEQTHALCVKAKQMGRDAHGPV